MYKLDAHLTGALNELRVQAYYTKCGWDVFSPVHNKTRSDFIAVRGKLVVRVQVKTAQYNNGYIQARLDVNGKTYTEDECDVVAFILEDKLWLAPIEQIEGYTSINLGKVEKLNYKPRKDYDPTEWIKEDFNY